MVPSDEPASAAPSWREHAEAAGRQLLALQAMIAMASPDDALMDAWETRLAALHAGVSAADDLDDLGSALTRYAVEFARRAHGPGFVDVLQGMHAELRAHVAGYDPPDPDGPR
jgi:hypothetical protein